MTTQFAPLPALIPAPGTGVGGIIGDAVGGVVSSGLDEAMKGVWEASMWVLNTAFSVADTFSTFTVDAHSGPVGAIWPTLLTVSGAIALGLFFWQLTLAVLRGGRGMMRAATGPIAYGIALAMTVAGIAAALAAADGLTTVILSKGLNADNFTAAFTHTSLGGAALNGVKGAALGVVGFFGILPAALGWVLEIIWRQAAILVLVATIPVTAAGLLAHTTASWFWRGLRWTIAAIIVKPALALIVVIGVSSLAGATGPVVLLAGVGVLWVSLTAPMALFRLLAFVDPGTDAGAAFREQFSALGSRLSGGGGGDSGGYTGFGSSGSGTGGGGGSGGGSVSSGGVGALEDANTARFDAAGGGIGGGQDAPAPPTGSSESGSGTGSSGSAGSGSSEKGGNNGAADSGSDPSAATGSSAGSGSGSSSDSGDSGGQGVPSAAPAPPGDAGSSHPTPYLRTGGNGSGAGSGGSGSGGAASGAAEEAIEAAVILS